MERKSAGLMVMITAIIFTLLGSILIFVPQIKLHHISYFVCGMITIAGVYFIVRYFMSDGYREFGNYGFSIGVFLGVVGIIGFIKTNEIVRFFPVAISILTLLMGVVILQDALDIKRMEKPVWIGVLVASIVTLLFATIVIINPFAVENTRVQLANIMLLTAGVLQLLSKIALRVALKE